MVKVIAMIPALLGSTRIKNKNLVLVNGYPLISYVIQACKDSNIFDDIYINSESEEFETISEYYGCKFFKRNPKYGGTKCIMKNKSMKCNSSRCQVHDHYITDFLENVTCDYIVQVHTTSPLIKPETIRAFVNTLKTSKINSIFSIEKKYSNTIVDNKPVNFTKNFNSKNQDLNPISIISWSLCGWNSKKFLESYYKNSKEETGPTYLEPIKLFPISSIEAIDIDNYEDLFIAEACLNHLKRKHNTGKFYYNKDIKEIDSNLKRLITRDGVYKFDDKHYNTTKINVKTIKNNLGKTKPWCYQLIYTDNDQVCIINQKPNNGCRKHYHITKDEWWYIINGNFKWETPNKIITAKKGDFIFMPKGTPHIITCIGTTPGTRLACGSRNMEHIYI